MCGYCYSSKKQPHSSAFHLKKKLPGVRTTQSKAATCKTKQSQETGVGAHIFSKHHLLTPLRRLQHEAMKRKKAHPKFVSLTVAGLAPGASWRDPETARFRSGRARWSPAERGPKLASAPTPELGPIWRPRRRPHEPRRPLPAPPAARSANFPPSPGGSRPAPRGARVPPLPLLPRPRAGGWGRGRLRLTRRAARTKRRPRRR